MFSHQWPVYRYQQASNLLVVTKWAAWQQLAIQANLMVDVRVTGQAIALIRGAGRRDFRIDCGLVCWSGDLYHETGQILVQTQGLSLKVYPDELWSEVVATFRRRQKTKG